MRFFFSHQSSFYRVPLILALVFCLTSASPALARHRHRPHHPPHRGTVVHHIHPAACALMIAGITYFVFSDIYYRRVPSGYMVVDAPPRDTLQAPVGQWAVVDIYALNVRSGPGLGHTILSYVCRGERLLIRGKAPAWYYVELPNGSYGWVMSKYTQMLAPLPEG